MKLDNNSQLDPNAIWFVRFSFPSSDMKGVPALIRQSMKSFRTRNSEE